MVLYLVGGWDECVVLMEDHVHIQPWKKLLSRHVEITQNHVNIPAANQYYGVGIDPCQEDIHG